jgi:uncharacterized protein involved in response to NO
LRVRGWRATPFALTRTSLKVIAIGIAGTKIAAILTRATLHVHEGPKIK